MVSAQKEKHSAGSAYGVFFDVCLTFFIEQLFFP